MGSMMTDLRGMHNAINMALKKSGKFIDRRADGISFLPTVRNDKAIVAGLIIPESRSRICRRDTAVIAGQSFAADNQ